MINWLVLIAIVYYLFKVLVDWATVSGAAAAVVNNQHQQGQSNPHQQSSTSSSSGVGATSSTSHQQQNFLLKPRNNRTPGEGTCYEIDNLALQDNSRYIPVRPIVRRNLLSEGSGAEPGEPHNTAVGVVIPTTPNSALHTFRLNDTAAGGAGLSSNINNFLNNSGGQKHILNPFHPQQQPPPPPPPPIPNLRASPLSSRVPDGASQNQLNLNKNSNQQQQQQQQLLQGAVGGVNHSKANVEDKLHQIQEYIKLTTNLISSVQLDNLNGPRPQSVQSVSTTHSTTPVQTPSYDDLQFKMESQSKSMQALKEQQAHLLRLQQAARLQLQEMEAIRSQTAASAIPLDNFESVDQVQDGISGIMERMRVLATFIQNQQELGNMLGGDNDDVLNEQVMLQQKFQELRDKKAQMHNLVAELQNMNVEAGRQFDGAAATGPVERTVPIELTNAPASAADMRKATKTFNQNNVDHGILNGGHSTSRGGSITPKADNAVNARETDLHDGEEHDEEDPEAITGTAEMLNEKINEINAMKSQLRRLKEMMDTVKLIEMKTGTSIDEEEDAPEENDENPESDENSRSPSVASQISDQGAATGPTDARREQLNQRVEALHAMTRDLREQAKSIAAERDALQIAQTEIQKRRNNVTELQQQAEAQTAEKLTNHVASFVSSIPPGPKERQQMALKAELEQKKRELERIANMTQNIKKNTELSRQNTEAAPPKVSSVSSAESLRSQNNPPVIPPPPAPSAVNNTTAGSNVTNHSKNSVDSGVTDIFANAQLESGSYQSSSTRSLNMVPPMPDICNRTERYRKSEDVGTSTARTDRTSPWPAHLFSAAGPSSSNTGPQSPHFHPFSGSDIHVSSAYPTYNTYPTYSNLLPPHTPNSAPPPPDPLMFQHFMQTQQMLMNSITQCNQLLWIQQREINNLNNAVLLLQERILKSANSSILMNDGHVSGAGAHIRAESTPPNNSLNSAPSMTGSLYGRACSEQPTMAHQQGPPSPYHTIVPTLHQPAYGSHLGTNPYPSFTPSTSQHHQQPHQQSTQQYSINQQIQRNNTNISNSNANAATASASSSHRSYRNLRHVNINTANNAIYEQQQLHHQLYDHHVPLHSNNFMNQNGTGSNDDSNLQSQQQSFNNATVSGGGNLGPSNMINNLANGPSTAGGMAPPPQSAACLNNLNNSSNLNSNAQQQTQALNNQVLPGVRANNYWDNFRSYSRQNLLSSNSCKSNEDSCTLSTNSCTNNNINNQIQRNNSNVNNFNNSNNASGSSCSGVGGSTGAKYPHNLNRNNSFNNVNQQNASSDLGPNLQQPSGSGHTQPTQHFQTISQQSQHQQQQGDGSQFQSMDQSSFLQQHPGQTQQLLHQQPQQLQQQQPHHTPLSQSTSFDLGELQFHTNPINLGLANKSGHPKGSGNKKYPLSLRSCRDGNNLGGESGSNFYGVGAHAEMVSDLNLATASNYQHDSKSTSKLFEALKENVYQEVKNLITANESRPHFLIQLFRELQLISSDPLRQRTLQSIQELYNRYIESTLQQEQQEGHVNNVGSNNLLSSNASVAGGGGQAASGSSEHPSVENVEVVEASQSFRQPPFQFAPSAESTPVTVTAGGSGTGTNAPAKDLEADELGGMPSSEIISIIMGDIVGVINSVDYINDSVLCKIAGVICNHATGASNGLFQQISPQQAQEQGLLGNPMLGPSMAAFLTQNETDVISREDFLRHLESWNRTDKDEFISNLENLLNNILLRSSAAEGDASAVSSSNMNGDEEGQMRAQQQQQQLHQQQHDSLSSFSNGNNNTTGDISADNNETFHSYANVGAENPFSSHVSTASGVVGGTRRVYGTSESDKMSTGVSSSNGYALTTYDLAEADQICDLDKVHPPGAVGGTANGGTDQMPQGNFDNRWRMLQNELDGDLADIMERNRMAEKAAQEQQQQQPPPPRGRAGEGWQDEESEDPEEQLPIFY